MRRFWKPALAAAALMTGVAACAYNEELGRSQLLFAGDMSAPAKAAWDQIKQQQRVSADRRYTSRLNRVAPKLIRAAGEDPAQWEYLVFEDDSLNAFALPGGRIGIHTGIMDIMRNDAQLAAVVGHEIAHVEYRHSAERASQNTLASIGIGVASVALGASCSGTPNERQACQQRSGAMVQALGIGAMYGAILPYSRKHELEADAGGVLYMARAGYDTCESLTFWQNMARASEGQARPPEFASTHPASDTRIENLRAQVNRMGRRCG